MSLTFNNIELAEKYIQVSRLSYPFLLNAVANVALIVWDILLTIEKEVAFITITRISLVKVLFFVVRYLSLSIQLGSLFFLFCSQHLEVDICPAYIWYLTVNGMIVIACSNLLFIHRVAAFYARDRAIVWFLGAAFAITETTVVVIIGLTVPKFHLVKNPFPELVTVVGGCVSGPYPNTIAFMWLTELVFQSVAFGCVIARCVYTQIMSSRDGVPASSLYTIFLRDGIWVYLLLFLTFVLNVVYTHQSNYNGLIPGLWSFTATSICCSRLILNLNSSVFRKSQRLHSDDYETL